VTRADPQSEQWRIMWQLWTKYFVLQSDAYEGRLASQVFARFA
jgi:hypothetical protein